MILTPWIQNMNRCQKRLSNTGGNSSWVVNRNIQRWRRNSCEGIPKQWPEVLPDFERLRPPRPTRKSLGNASWASTPAWGSVQTCGHQHSHNDIVVPIILWLVRMRHDQWCSAQWANRNIDAARWARFFKNHKKWCVPACWSRCCWSAWPLPYSATAFALCPDRIPLWANGNMAGRIERGSTTLSSDVEQRFWHYALKKKRQVLIGVFNVHVVKFVKVLK